MAKGGSWVVAEKATIGLHRELLVLCYLPSIYLSLYAFFGRVGLVKQGVTGSAMEASFRFRRQNGPIAFDDHYKHRPL